MALQSDLSNLSVRQFAERHREDLLPIANSFAFYSSTVPFTEEDSKEYLEEPLAALPPAIIAQLPKVFLFLVPYLQQKSGREKRGGEVAQVLVSGESADSLVASSSLWLGKDEAALLFALEDQEVADYHYRLYHMLAALIADRWPEEVKSEYLTLLREELNGGIHGEVDEESWRGKQALKRRQQKVRRDSKAFQTYAKASFVDTLTLYLHGICCDIDVETGPRQLPSRHLRKRLNLFLKLYPPPQGLAVFPEDLQEN